MTTTAHPAQRTAPHSSDAERTVLGACIQDPDAITRIADTLQPEDFYDPVYRQIYASLQQLAEEGAPVDFITVAETLGQNATIQAKGGSAFLAALATEVPTSSHVEQYAQIVRDKSEHRQLIELGRRVTELGYDADKSAEELMEAAEHAFLALSQRRKGSDPVQLAALRDERFERYTELYEADDKSALYGIRSGFPDLDRKLTGLAPAQMIVLAARPSMGKTALALDIAVNAACAQGKSVTIFSLEMSNQELFDRLFAKGLRVPAWKLERGTMGEEDFGRMGEVMDQFGDYPLYFDDTANTIFEICSKARRQQMRHGLDLLIVDYLQLIHVDERWARENQTQRMSFISRCIKQLARELRVPVIALSQLNREVEKRPGNKPMLADLRDSGSIEQDADRILMLYREDYYDEDTDRPGITDVFVRKNRNGPTGQVELTFDKAMMTFASVAREAVV